MLVIGVILLAIAGFYFQRRNDVSRTTPEEKSKTVVTSPYANNEACDATSDK